MAIVDVGQIVILRKEFNSRVKKDFLSELGKVDDDSLKNMGLLEDDISLIRLALFPMTIASIT